jgi:3-dehydroquinate synthase
MNWKVNAQLTVEFEIEKTNNIFQSILCGTNRTLIVIDKNVHNLYKHLIPNDAVLHIIDCKELTKDQHTTNDIINFFNTNKVLRRSEPIIAIGGGVLLDLVGYACAIYRRGIPYIKVPTTLLGIVDASIGSKVGINYNLYRNRLGNYYPPVKTYIDKTFIKTQDNRNISNGIAEIIKIALIKDKKLFDVIDHHIESLIESKFQSTIGDTVIDMAIDSMLVELESNLWEKDLKRNVDFGHSFSPLVEMKNAENVLHGEMVILDCLLSSVISHNKQLLTHDELTKIFLLVKRANLPTSHNDFFNVELLIESLTETTYHRNGNQNLPLPNSIGDYLFSNDITRVDISEALEIWKQF